MTRSSGALCILTVLALATPGCTRWTGYAQARRGAIHEGLTSLHLGAGSRAMLTQSAFLPRCDIAPDGNERCVMRDGTATMTLLDDPEGSHVVSAEGNENQLTAMWRRLDTTSYAKFSNTQLEPLAQVKLEEDAAAFTPRWGLVAGVSSGFGADSAASLLGGRLGIRRWFDVHFGAHAAVEYQFNQIALEHTVGLRLGGDLARFTEGRFFGKLGVAPAAVSFFTGPMLGTFDTRFGVVAPPTLNVWWRTGVGLTVTDWYWAPMFVEFMADTVLDTQRQPGVRFVAALGFGF